jgi:hypothetical protein
MKTQDYINQAHNFLLKTNTTLKITFKTNEPYFEEDKKNNTSRDIYNCTLKRGSRSYSFKFGQSINGTQLRRKPNEYDILSCVEKYDPESFEDFCSNYGYDTYSRTAEKTYKACVDQYNALCTLFSDKEMEMLRDIQ